MPSLSPPLISVRAGVIGRGTVGILSLGVHDMEIVLGVLIKVLSGDPIAGGCRFACQRRIALEHLTGPPADLYVWASAVECPRSMMWAAIVWMIGIAPVVAATMPLALAQSHDTFWKVAIRDGCVRWASDRRSGRHNFVDDTPPGPEPRRQPVAL
jgi:hypothetical protein